MSLPDEEPEEEAEDVELAECSAWCDCGRLVASASELPGLELPGPSPLNSPGPV